MLLLKMPAKQGIIAESEAKKQEMDFWRDERH
jgi:hypothetical protein